MVPGEIVHPEGQVEGNVGARTVELEVTNTLDRAIQVTSHYHFFEANRAPRFDREAAYGMRLDVPAGRAVRFETGETQTVRLCEIGGRRIVRGFHGLVNGWLDDQAVRHAALERARARGFNVAFIARAALAAPPLEHALVPCPSRGPRAPGEDAQARHPLGARRPGAPGSLERRARHRVDAGPLLACVAAERGTSVY